MKQTDSCQRGGGSGGLHERRGRVSQGAEMHDSLTTVNQWPEGMGKGSEGGREVAKGWGNGDICNRVKNKNKVKKKSLA